MTVAELLARASSRELTQWAAYETVTGPLGPERDDILHARLMAAVASINHSKGRKPRPADFIPQWDKRRRQSTSEQIAQVKAINQALGGTTTQREG